MNKEIINNVLDNIEEQKKFETSILEKQIKQRLNLQIVIGLDNLKILLDAYPDSEWELVQDNGEGSYYE